jgi:NADPH:quinone reductase-like Zn-dependent oxidoreductase
MRWSSIRKVVTSRSRFDLDDVCYRVWCADRRCEDHLTRCRSHSRSVEQRRAAAIQITNSVGAKSIVLTRTSAKRKQLTDAGAKYVIATEEEDLVRAINEITGGQGARVVFDPVGGPTLLKLIKAMSFQGIFYLYGALSDQATTVPPLDLIGKIVTIKGHNIWVTSGDPSRQKAAVDFVINGLDKGTLKPIIDPVFPFDKIVDAHRDLEASAQIGKIVVTI